MYQKLCFGQRNKHVLSVCDHFLCGWNPWFLLPHGNMTFWNGNRSAWELGCLFCDKISPCGSESFFRNFLLIKLSKLISGLLLSPILCKGIIFPIFGHLGKNFQWLHSFERLTKCGSKIGEPLYNFVWYSSMTASFRIFHVLNIFCYSCNISRRHNNWFFSFSNSVYLRFRRNLNFKFGTSGGENF